MTLCNSYQEASILSISFNARQVCTGVFPWPRRCARHFVDSVLARIFSRLAHRCQLSRGVPCRKASWRRAKIPCETKDLVATSHRTAIVVAPAQRARAIFLLWFALSAPVSASTNPFMCKYMQRCNMLMLVRLKAGQSRAGTQWNLRQMLSCRIAGDWCRRAGWNGACSILARTVRG